LDYLYGLLGLRIAHVEFVFDGLFITFSNDSILTVLNDYHYNSGSWSTLAGREVMGVDVQDQLATLHFEDQSHLTLELSLDSLFHL